MRTFNHPAKDFLLYPSDEPFLKQLAPESRRLLELATNDGMSYNAIAIAHLGRLPMGTVKSRIHRARERVLLMRAAAAAAGASQQLLESADD